MTILIVRLEAVLEFVNLCEGLGQVCYIPLVKAKTDDWVIIALAALVWIFLLATPLGREILSGLLRFYETWI